MKDSWVLQQREAERNAAAVDPHTLPELRSPANSWRLRGGSRGDIMYDAEPLRNGDGVLALYVSNEGAHRITQYGPKFTRPRDLMVTNIARNVTCYLVSLDNVIVIMEEEEDEAGIELQTLRTRNLESGVPGENTFVFRNSCILCFAMVLLDDESSLIVLGDKKGKLHLIRYREGVMTKDKQIDGVHRRAIQNIHWHGNRFWAVSKDEMITIWDTNTKRLVGCIRSPCRVYLVMTNDYIFTDVNGIIRVYENKHGLKLRWVMKLPVFGLEHSSTVYQPLTNDVGVLHDDNGIISFYKLLDGTVISRMKSPFKSIRCLWVLADTTILIASLDCKEGHAILSVKKSDAAYEALVEFARVNYPDTKVHESVMATRMKWARGIGIAAVAIGGVKTAIGLLTKKEKDS